MGRMTMILFFVSACYSASFAQNGIAIIGGGIYSRSNLNNQNLSVKERVAFDQELSEWRAVSNASENKAIYRGKLSGYAGLVWDIKITNAFYIKSKLVLVMKGWQEKNDYSTDSVFFTRREDAYDNSHKNIPDEHTKSIQDYNLTYLELPIAFTFYAPVKKSLIYIGVGPYVSYGLSGRYRYKVVESNKENRSDSTVNLKINFSNKPSDNLGARKFDYGAAVDVGVELRNRISIIFHYAAGFVDVFEKRYWAFQNRNRDLRIGFGYYIKDKHNRRL